MNDPTFQPASRSTTWLHSALAITAAALWGLIEFIALCRSRWLVRR